MAPIATQTTSELTKAGIENTISKTASSIATKATSTQLDELDASKLIFTPNQEPKSVPELDSQEVWDQKYCTDHMITCQWTSVKGWEAPQCRPYGPLSLMPTASVLHYATECFEGLKVYRGYDKQLRLFRPDRNARRMLNSATRISLPAFNPEELQKLIEALVSVDGEKWLPRSRPGTFLYLRPTMIANGAALGVQKPKEALLYIIANFMPSFDTGTGTAGLDGNASQRAKERPGMKLLASSEDTVRAWPGGFGFAKVGANYGPSLIAQAEARARGYDQVLWLLGEESNVTEAGASNFFVVWRTKEGRVQLVTAPLTGKIILDGVTRGSVLELARERLHEEVEVVERTYTMSEVAEAVEEGRLLEAFATGTAFFISGVSKIHFRGKDLEIPMSEGQTGKYAGMLKQWLRNIMYGEEVHQWGVVVKEKQI
ncbi:branched-chain amino acid aminotransferase, partial [Lecanoromycetidae sp. Uapishka_2]